MTCPENPPITEIGSDEETNVTYIIDEDGNNVMVVEVVNPDFITEDDLVLDDEPFEG